MGISRRSFMKMAAVGAACLHGGAAGKLFAAAGKSDAKRPNIVMILADDLGYECIGADGGTSYKTPVLDKLAAEGVRFDHGYSQPLCTPTRVQTMTGIYNVRNYIRFGLLDPKQTTFAHLLKKAGYATCVVGKWQLGGGLAGPGHFGFDEYCLWQLNRRPGRYPNPGLEVNGKQIDYTNGEYGPDVVSDFACDFMGRNKDKPFCLYYPMILTHCPFVPTPDSPDWDPKATGEPSYKGDAKYFGDMVTYMDKIVGKLLARLDELGLRENTLVIFMGDNGTDTPVISKMGGKQVAGAKGTTTDAGDHVPLIASFPAGGGKGKVCNDLVDTSDILPTICECAGVQVPAALAIDGQSFLPQIRGEKGKPREWTYCWYSRQGAVAGTKEYARNQRYKLYRDGRFYDILTDELEKSPLPGAGLVDELTKSSQAGAGLTNEALKTRVMLQEVLDKYAKARPAALLKGGGAKKKPKGDKKGKKRKTQ